MGLFDRNDGGPVDVPATAPAEAIPEDTGVRARGTLLLAFDLEDEQEYAFPASRVAYVTDGTSPLEEHEVEGARTRIRFEDLDGYLDLLVSAEYGQVLEAWLAALGWEAPR